MIHYNGGRHSTWQVAVEIWKRRHALVSFADPQQIVVASEVAQSFALDNGAFSVWKQGVEVGWTAYYGWVEEWRRHPGFDWAVIPDVIEGDEAANDALLVAWPFARHVGVPVWHFHESLERLSRLAGEWPRLALGSSGQYGTIGTPKWWSRVQQIMETVCEGGAQGQTARPPDAPAGGLPAPPARERGFGGRLARSRDDQLGRVLSARLRSRPRAGAPGLVRVAQSAAVWTGIPAQEELFG